MSVSERKTIAVSEKVHEKLKSLKPYDSVSFNDLLDDMADQYDPPRNG